MWLTKLAKSRQKWLQQLQGLQAKFTSKFCKYKLIVYKMKGLTELAINCQVVYKDYTVVLLSDGVIVI